MTKIARMIVVAVVMKEVRVAKRAPAAVKQTTRRLHLRKIKNLLKENRMKAKFHKPLLCKTIKLPKIWMKMKVVKKKTKVVKVSKMNKMRKRKKQPRKLKLKKKFRMTVKIANLRQSLHESPNELSSQTRWMTTFIQLWAKAGQVKKQA